MGFAEYGRYDALGLAELVRQGEVSADGIARRGARAHGRGQPADQRGHPPDGRPRARRPSPAGLPDGPFRGVPFLVKDLMTAYAGEPMRFGSRLFQHYVPVDRRRAHAPLSRSRARDLRQDQHAGARRLERHRARTVRADAQSVEPRAHVRADRAAARRRRRGAHRAGRQRERRRRLDPHARRPIAGSSASSPVAVAIRRGPQRARRLVRIHRRTRRLRAACATAPRCSTRPAGDYPQQLLKLPAPARPLPARRRGASPAGCASPSRSIRASAARCIPKTAALEATVTRARRPRPRSRRGAPAAADRDSFVSSYAALIGGGRGGDAAAGTRRSWAARRAATTSNSPPGCWRSMGEAQSGGDVTAALWTMQAVLARSGSRGASRVRRAADADGRRAAAADRRVSSCRRCNDRALKLLTCVAGRRAAEPARQDPRGVRRRSSKPRRTR